MKRNVPSLSKSIITKLMENRTANCIAIKENKIWNWKSKQQLLNGISNARDFLQEYNIDRGDRVAYKGDNSINWVAWNIATNSLGAVWVPMYTNQPEKYTSYVIEDCNPKLFISTQPDLEVNKSINISNSLDFTKEMTDFHFKCNELSTLIYTSGTTGNPKGVMLSNNNILTNIESVERRFHNVGKTTSLNILPWAHIYSQTCELYYNLLNDNPFGIATNKDKFIEECKEFKPQVLYLVPRVLEVIKDKVAFLDKPIIKIVLPLVLKHLFGNNLKYIFTGGAKLNHDVKDFYEKNKIIICEGYGCTETAPMISVNHYNTPRNINSIGKILDNVIVEIINDEIHVAGENVMMGYWNDAEKTKDVIIEKNGIRFYKTGDSGEIKDGYLYYKNRISTNYKLSNGKFVDVETTESLIKKHICGPFIIFGENLKNNRLICTTDVSLENVNKELDNHMKIDKIYKLDLDVFSTFYTPKLSIKRKEIIKHVLNI